MNNEHLLTLREMFPQLKDCTPREEREVLSLFPTHYWYTTIWEGPNQNWETVFVSYNVEDCTCQKFTWEKIVTWEKVYEDND